MNRTKSLSIVLFVGCIVLNRKLRKRQTANIPPPRSIIRRWSELKSVFGFPKPKKKLLPQKQHKQQKFSPLKNTKKPNNIYHQTNKQQQITTSSFTDKPQKTRKPENHKTSKNDSTQQLNFRPKITQGPRSLIR